jgi:hypothetical protein
VRVGRIIVGWALSIALSGCGAKSGPTPASAPRTSAASAETQPAKPLRTDLGSVTGRVLLDGKPVPYYGVNLDPGCCPGRATSIRSADGRFTIQGRPGVWDIVIVGPSFGQFVARGRELVAGATLDLGDVAMTHGHTIVGHVTDVIGRPVGGASVTITTSLARAEDDDLTAWSRGNFATTSDARGAFRFEEVHVFDLAGHRPKIVAKEDDAVSPEVEVPTNDATIDLVVWPAGGIDGEVNGANRSGATVHAHPLSGDRVGDYAEVGADGKFRFENQMPGDYDLQLLPAAMGVASPPVERVTVLANHRAAAVIKLPQRPVTISVHVSGGPCELVELEAATGEPSLGQQECSGSQAEITGVAPGKYRVCVFRSCVPIDVKPSPARQSFELVTKL